ncbi:uncharacterized protein LOC111497913 isoform X2 [Cucurbita maxima]|uniref:Uncharacterized protein LOC111497913 isoform X2 n=1 Tax=Cucurbita maxima TaxID=3661 RepID=A0A6J1KX19_CUCMA|nr:uncharacterized protein LOC111497913 isoform X2 [Cucurbita maxima]
MTSSSPLSSPLSLHMYPPTFPMGYLTITSHWSSYSRAKLGCCNNNVRWEFHRCYVCLIIALSVLLMVFLFYSISVVENVVSYFITIHSIINSSVKTKRREEKQVHGLWPCTSTRH